MTAFTSSRHFTTNGLRLGPRLAALLMAVVFLGLLAACDSVEERAEKHYENGVELLAEGEPVKASLEFRNALKLNDSHVGANLEMGKFHEERKNYSAAVHQYRKVISLDSSQLDAHVHLAQILLAFNETEQALTSTLAAAQLAPDDPEVVALEAVVAMRVGEIDRAKEKAQRALELNPDNGDAWIVLAAISRREQDDEKALEQTDEGWRRDPDNIRVLLFRINLLSQMDRNDDLGRDLKLLTELEPSEISFWDSLVRWQLRNNQFDEATATLRTISDLAPDDTDRQLDLVRLLIATKGREAGVEELARLIDLREGTESQGKLELAMVDVEIQLQEFDAAEARLKRLIETMADQDEVLDTARIGLARLLLRRDDVAGALKLVEETLAADATHAKALTMRGRIRILEEDYDAAIRDLRAAEAEAPDDVETLRLLAVAHDRNGSKDLALERMAAAVEASDHGVEPVLEYARELIGEGRTDAAEVVVTDAIAKKRNNVRLLDTLARIKLRRKDFAGAESIARAFQQNEETKELGDRLLAASLSGQERYEETIRLLQASTSESNDGAYLAALVATHLQNKDMAAAKGLIDKALADDPKDSNAIRLKATLAMVENQGEEAGDLFRSAVAAGPQVAMNHLALYRFHARRGEIDIAEIALRKGIEDTDSNILHLNLAILLERTGRIDDAIKEYHLLYERQPGSEIIANNLASLMSDNDPTAEELDRAFVIAKRLRESEVPHFQDTYAWIQYLRGDYQGALETLEEARKKLPDNPIVAYHLGVTLAELGETERARTELERAIELAGDNPVPQIAGAKERLESLAPASDPAPAAE